MPTFTYTIGLPGSGKTTWAREEMKKDPNIRRVNRDDIRAMVQDHWTPKGEKLIKTIRDGIIVKVLSAGHNVICDDTNLDHKTQAHLADVKNWVVGGSYHLPNTNIVSKSFLDVPLHVCISRDEKRTNPVGASVIRDMWTKHIKPNIQPQDRALPNAVICDLDGTLALLNGRDPYDASTCDRDLCNDAVRTALQDARFRGSQIIFVSGREDKYRPQTEKFLTYNMGWLPGENCIYKLFMRSTDDFRNDAEIKEEIYNTHIRDRFYIELVLDDRDRVVDMWRGLGLDVFQVGYGNF